MIVIVAQIVVVSMVDVVRAVNCQIVSIAA
jgi:hypothetical protein